MTKNQIDFMALQESKRHNQASEEHNVNVLAETKRSNLANEFETKRSNTAREAETYRHNYVSEDLNLSNLSETKRHNIATESLQDRQSQEVIRHNKVLEQISTISTLADKAYKEAQSALRSQELDLAERKEVQRISESLRDFNELVRRTDLQTLTSNGLVRLIEQLGVGSFGLAAGAGATLGTSAVVGAGSGAVSGYLTGPKSNALVSTLGNIAKNAMIIPDMLIDLATSNTIRPGGGSRPASPNTPPDA